MAIFTPRFEDALAFAAGLHREQLRKASAVPYVAHLLAVAAVVIEHGGDEEEAIAALLHDAVEDQGGAAVGEQIRHRFGPRVAAIVDACSDSQLTPKPLWQARKEAHLRHVAAAAAEVQLVVAADKLHNVRSLVADYRRLGEALWQHFRGGKAGTLWYYRGCLAAVRQGAPPALVAELERTIVELERLAAAGSATT